LHARSHDAEYVANSMNKLLSTNQRRWAQLISLLDLVLVTITHAHTLHKCKRRGGRRNVGMHKTLSMHFNGTQATQKVKTTSTCFPQQNMNVKTFTHKCVGKNCKAKGKPPPQTCTSPPCAGGVSHAAVEAAGAALLDEAGAPRARGKGWRTQRPSKGAVATVPTCGGGASLTTQSACIHGVMNIVAKAITQARTVT